VFLQIYRLAVVVVVVVGCCFMPKKKKGKGVTSRFGTEQKKIFARVQVLVRDVFLCVSGTSTCTASREFGDNLCTLLTSSLYDTLLVPVVLNTVRIYSNLENNGCNWPFILLVSVFFFYFLFFFLQQTMTVIFHK
jgi:hypothetical protein